MRRGVFIAVIIVEILAALVSMGLLFSDVGAMIYPISMAAFAVALSPFFLWLMLAKDEAKKRRARLWMVLIMLIPIITAIIMVLAVVTALFMCF